MCEIFVILFHKSLEFCVYCAIISFGEQFLHTAKGGYVLDRYAIGVDIGTTSTKAILFDRNGTALKKAFEGYTILSPKPLFREMNPDTIADAVIHTIRKVMEDVPPDEVQLVSFSAMMHSLLAVDGNGRPLTNCMIWADGRSTAYARTFGENGEGLAIYQRTGTPCHPMSPLYKLMWLRDHQQEVFQKAAKFISIKEYLFYKFCGNYLVDASVASATGLYNLFTGNWDTEVLQLLGLKASRFSEVVSTTFRLPAVHGEMLTAMGLNAHTAFIAGGSDGCLANLGSGAVTNGTAAVTIGTSGAVRVCFDKPVTDSQGRVFCYVLSEDKYIVGGPINNGGIVYQWFRNTFGQEEQAHAESDGLKSYAYLDRYIEETPPGSHDLLFLPFLMGERAPYWNADMRGAFVGVTDAHTKKDFTRACIESVCYAINSVFQIVASLVGEIGQVHVDGGFTKNAECVHILCDVLNADLSVFENTESACFGSVILGWKSLGVISSLETRFDAADTVDTYQPREQNRACYDRLFHLYTQAVEGLLPVFEGFAKK